MPEGMTYIVQCKDRFYVVADAELAAARIDRDNAGTAPARGGPVHLREFLSGTWLPDGQRREVAGGRGDMVTRLYRLERGTR